MKQQKEGGVLRSSDCWDALFVGLCSGSLLVYSLFHHYTDRNTSEWKTSPFLFPLLLSAAGLLLAVSLVSETRKKGEGTETKNDRGKNMPAVLVTMITALLYCFLLPILHFIPATVLFLAALLLLLGERRRGRIALLSVLTAWAVYVLFALGLQVRLP